MKRRLLSALISIALLPVFALAQLAVSSGQTPGTLVQDVLLGGGVTVSNITFNGQPATTANEQAASFNSADANVGLPSGILLATGDAAVAMGPNNNGGAYLGGYSGYADADLSTIAGVAVFDAAVLEFDFVPMGGEISFDFVFASEEYIEYVGAGFNDVFGFFLSGPGINGPYSDNSVNIALVPGTTTPVSIDNVNPMSNAGFYTDNGDGYAYPYSNDAQYIQYDGFTVPLTASHAVQCGQTYHIKLAVADAGDEILDSGVFLEAGAFTSPVPTLNLSDVNVPCMTATTVDLSVSGGTGPYEVTWTLNGNTIGAGMSLPVTASGSDTYQVTVVDACGGTTTGSVQVNSLPPQVNVPGTLDIACGEQGALTMTFGQGGNNGLALAWSANGSLVGNTADVTVVPPAQATWYVASASDACGGTASDSTLVSSSINPISISVSQDPVLPCEAPGTTIAVIGVEGATGSLTYAWTSNGAQLGNAAELPVGNEAAAYTAIVTDGCGAVASATVVVSEQTYPAIEVVLAGDAPVTCAGQIASAEVVSISGGTGDLTHVWNDADGTDLSTSNSITTAVNGSLVFTVVATDNCGHMGSAQVTLSITEHAPLAISVPNAMVCENGSRELIAVATGGAGSYTYAWPAFPDADSAVTVSPEVPTTYNVSVTDLCGTVAHADALVGIEHPVTNIFAESIGYNDFAFSTHSLPAAEQFSWSFGDGQESSASDPEHAYADMQPTLATVTTLTINGCLATDTIQLTPAAQLFFPNAFTPNGDGFNDTFGATGLLLEEFELVIFDRWGAEVAAVSGVGATWNGRMNNGQIAPTGVYVYSFRAAGERLEETKGLGHVTLLGDESGSN